MDKKKSFIRKHFSNLFNAQPTNILGIVDIFMQIFNFMNNLKKI